MKIRGLIEAMAQSFMHRKHNSGRNIHIVDALQICDSNGDTATDDLSSSNPQPPDCDSDLDSDDGQMNNDSDALNTSTQIQPIPSTQPDPDPPDTNWEAIFAVLSAHAEQIIQQSLSNLRRPTT